MNRSNFIEEVSKRSGIDKDELSEIFNIFLEVAIENIHNLSIRGFGKFQARIYKPKIYHDVVENKLKKSATRVRIAFVPSEKILRNLKKEIREYF
ncbi:HU family DNA-binding protein [Thermoanaerobacter thermohydrosulfuricus]